MSEGDATAPAAATALAPAPAVPEVSLAGVGVLLLHRGDPQSVAAMREWLKAWYADPYAFTSSFGRGTQRFFASIAARLDAGTWAKRLTDAGGKSPLEAQANELAGLLGKKLGVPVALGTLYTDPKIPDALKQLAAQGVTRVIGLSLYPQKCDRFLKPLLRAPQRMQPRCTSPAVRKKKRGKSASGASPTSSPYLSGVSPSRKAGVPCRVTRASEARI